VPVPWAYKELCLGQLNRLKSLGWEILRKITGYQRGVGFFGDPLEWIQRGKAFPVCEYPHYENGIFQILLGEIPGDIVSFSFQPLLPAIDLDLPFYVNGDLFRIVSSKSFLFL